VRIARMSARAVEGINFAASKSPLQSAPLGQFMEMTKMRPLIRSLFLLSLAAAPLAVGGTTAPAATSSSAVVSDTASDSASVESSSREEALLRSQVQDLESTVNGMRRELERVREEEDSRVRVIGDPNVHSLWP
jgi:septal ring factor EnvC (AmiA/AmiB activator)